MKKVMLFILASIVLSSCYTRLRTFVAPNIRQYDNLLLVFPYKVYKQPLYNRCVQRFSEGLKNHLKKNFEKTEAKADILFLKIENSDKKLKLNDNSGDILKRENNLKIKKAIESGNKDLALYFKPILSYGDLAFEYDVQAIDITSKKRVWRTKVRAYLISKFRARWPAFEIYKALKKDRVIK